VPPTLEVFLTSTREQRGNTAVARWFIERAQAHGHFKVVPVDLAEVALPLLDEPNHPKRRHYTKAHTQAWSRTVAAADAFVFVTPEYNYGMPPALLNAIDYLYDEWSYKPAAFVSYGGISGGTRSVEMSKGVLTAVKVMPIPEMVSIPFYTKLITPDGGFAPGEAPAKAAAVMLDELARWSAALAPLRAERKSP
jgi:NAD(P)H-dependent FMN reductase